MYIKIQRKIPADSHPNFIKSCKTRGKNVLLCQLAKARKSQKSKQNTKFCVNDYEMREIRVSEIYFLKKSTSRNVWQIYLLSQKDTIK